LVIGNSAYGRDKIYSPELDAVAVTEVLERLGFAVKTVKDVKAEQFTNSIRDFCAIAANADVAVFYYSGHP
jgi:uncharacterized caspase-like protein